jgi:hypothetical protein
MAMASTVPLMLPVETKWTGDPDVEPEAGDEMVTPAKAATADIKMVPRIRSVLFKTNLQGDNRVAELSSDYPSKVIADRRGSA